MKTPYTFRRANSTDDVLIESWFRSPHVMEFWGDPVVNMGDFRDNTTGTATLYDYWIGEEGHTPFCLLITSDAAHDTPDHLAPYLSDVGDVWTLDVLIGPESYMGRGIAAKMIEGFLSYTRDVNPNLQLMLIDPEENNPRAIHVYEKAGFRRASTFTPETGPFQGKAHVLLAYHFV